MFQNNVLALYTGTELHDVGLLEENLEIQLTQLLYFYTREKLVKDMDIYFVSWCRVTVPIRICMYVGVVGQEPSRDLVKKKIESRN